MDTLDHIRVVLVEPEHPGNIGAAARAMANMGLRHLVLVAPNDFPSYEANARASGAPTLQHARVVETLDEALTDCTLVIAASARVRTIAWPQKTAELAMRELAQRRGQAALVFGRESTGLTNDELDRCQFQTRIPVDEAFSSLNLGCAVSVLLYELRRQALTESPQTPTDAAPVDLANASDMRHFYDHLGTILERSDPGERFSNRLRIMTRIFNRASVTSSEIRLLRGVLSSIEARLGAVDD